MSIKNASIFKKANRIFIKIIVPKITSDHYVSITDYNVGEYILLTRSLLRFRKVIKASHIEDHFGNNFAIFWIG